jgi:hypothetical protein
VQAVRERSEDPSREARRATAVHELQQLVEVDRAVGGESIGEIRGEAALEESAATPADDILRRPTSAALPRGPERRDRHTLLVSFANRRLTRHGHRTGQRLTGLPGQVFAASR